MTRLGIKHRLLLAVVGAVALAVCALVIGFNLLLDRELTRDANSLVRARAAAELGLLRPVGGSLRLAEAPDEASPDAQVWVFSKGRVLEAPRAGEELQRAARSAAAHPFRYTDVSSVDLRLYALPAVFGGRRLGTVVAGTSLAPYEQSKRTALIGSLVLVAAVLLLVTAAALWLLRASLRPVVRMTRQAAAWSERDLDKRFGVGPPTDELTELASTLDALLDRLAASLRREQRFSAELSHELRTPLSRVIAETELALRRERAPAEYRASLEVVHRAAQQLSRTVDALVAAARHEAGGARGTADAYEIAAEAAGACAAVAQERELEIRVEPPVHPIRLGLDPELAERILQPVIENACRYGRRSVRVSIARADATVTYSVEDDGPGVSEEEHERIFEPGLRGHSTENGAGLGLALSRRLARSVSGDVEALAGSGRGRFSITLPAA